MVDKLQSESIGNVDEELPSNLVGSTCQASIVSATKGAIVVSLTINQQSYSGVLLQASKDLKPAVISLPRAVDKSSEEELKRRTLYLSEPGSAADDCDRAGIGPTLLNRHTYLEPDVERTYQNVIPRQNLHKIHERKRLRVRQARPSLFLCSLCKTHCFDTESGSEREYAPPSAEKRDTTPAIKISYKNPDGLSVMDIVPQKSSKSSHKRKHKSKHKKGKRSRHDRDVAERSFDGDESPLDRSQADVQPDSASDVDTRLVIDAPDSADGGSRPSEAATGAAATVLSKEHKKSPKVKPAKSKAKKPSADANGSGAPTNARSVSTYEGPDGKIVSVGDVIWGKIVGFPWWPGRVCAISVTESPADGLILDYVADIDWYCSPTKSHLSCKQIYPFLETFEKRVDKKKRSGSYKKAIDEAKYDAVIQAQYLESLMHENAAAATDNPASAVQQGAGNSPASSFHSSPTSKPADADDPASGSYVSGTDAGSSQSETRPAASWPHRSDGGTAQSPSVLIDAFLRDDGNADIDSKINHEMSRTEIPTTEENSNQDWNTISLPSPQSLLNTP